MMYSTLTILFFITINFVSGQSFCPKGCKCKESGYCYECEAGYYMQDGECKSCLTNCRSCLSSNTCEKCDRGYYTNKSEDSSLSCNPCSTGCTQCTSKTNCLKCNAGYFRTGYGCAKCPPECKTCKSESRCNTCIDGHILNGTSCRKNCSEGYFKSGYSCLPCPERCASCSITNKCTKCKQGFFGKLCDLRCSSGCDDNICEQITGKCTCKDGGLGCYQCKPQKYGLPCNTDCPEACLACDSDENCTKLCDTGYFWRCYCSEGCLDNKCETLTGVCRQCKPFFKWPCVECVHGKWGRNCSKDCQAGCLSCVSETNCTKCKNGYYNLDEQCLSCPKNCLNAVCNDQSGSCNDGCIPGYWGKSCDKPCPKNCLYGTCHNENGTCRLGCKDDNHGNMCKCPNNCICNSTDSTGQCLLSCLNYIRDDNLRDKEISSDCLKCSQGGCEHCGNYTLYGQFCDKECSNTCIDRHCDTLTGRCTSGCLVGYFGDSCSKECRGNCHKLPCNRETRICENEETDRDHILLKVTDVNVILMTCVAVLVIYAIMTTFILIRKRNIPRHQLNANVTSEENAENNYQPTVHVYRNAAGSDHTYAVADATSSGSVPLVNIEKRNTGNSNEDRDMYIHPVYAEKAVRHEYEEII